MAVIKEWRCECGREFEAIAAVCPRCARMAKRAWRTAFGINGGGTKAGSAKRIDTIMEREFAARGISNFSNRGGVNKVEYARLVSSHPGVYSTGMHGAPAQPGVAAQFVQGGLSNPQLGGEVRMMVDGKAWSVPRDDGGVLVSPGSRVGSGSTELLGRTEVAGRTDNRGNQV